jgi:Tfp pilus assembly protein PilN
MVEINLLPWRACLREYNKKKRMQLAIILSFLSLALFVILYGWLNAKLHTEHEIVLRLQKQWAAVHKTPAQRDDIKSVLNRLTTLQDNQAQLSIFFKQLMQFTPEGMVWQTIIADNEQLLLTGSTTSFQLLLEFVKLFDGKQQGFQADIVKIKSLPHSDLMQFSLRFSGVMLPLPNWVEKQHD